MGKRARRRNRSKAERDERSFLQRHPQVAIAALTAVLLLPFIGKAFTIDDPLFVRAAQQITQHPFDPYGFDINWYGRKQPISAVMINPPLTSYVLAIASALVGWSESGLHFVFIGFAILAAVSTWSLARRFCQQPFIAAVLTVVTPVFLISATNVMSDVAMLACFVTALALWCGGIDDDRPRRLWAAAVMAAIAGLFKYFGFAAAPLMLVYALVKRRQVGAYLVPLFVPVAVAAAYQIVTGSLGKAATYAGNVKTEANAAVRTLLTLGFMGGGVLAIVFAAPFLLSSKRRSVAATAAVIIAAVAFTFAGQAPLHIAGDPVAFAELAIFVAGGCGIVLLAAADAFEHRDAASITLASWIVGTAIFVAYINWTVNGRTILPLVPAAAILIARRLRASRAATAVIISATAFVGLLVSAADFELANAQRDASRQIMERYGADGHRIWFEGHWGFQYYMTNAGAAPIDLDETVHRNDLLIAPSMNTLVLATRPPHRIIERLSIPIRTPVSTMDLGTHAGFYSDFMGPLPYSFAPPAPQTFTVMRLGRS